MLPTISKVLVAAGSKSATGNSGAIPLGSDIQTALFYLNCTACTGTNDVSIEVTPDNGTTWYEVLRFTQLTGAAHHQILVNTDRKLDAGAIRAVTMDGTGALNANVPLSDQIRVKWTIGTGPCTFSVGLIATRRQV